MSCYLQTIVTRRETLISQRRNLIIPAGAQVDLDERRLAIGKSFSQDFTSLEKLFIYPEAFPVLQYFSCLLDRSPLPNPDPAIESFPSDDSKIYALGERLQKYHGSIIKRAGGGEEYSFFLSAEKLEERRAEDDVIEERATTPGTPQLTWSIVAMVGWWGCVHVFSRCFSYVAS